MRRACTEVDEILKYLPKEYVDKVPQKFRRMFYDARLEDDKVKIDPNLSITQQNVVYETLVILTILKMNYWCNSKEEKDRIQKKLEANEKQLLDKYDISKLNAKPANDFSNSLSTSISNGNSDISLKLNTNLPVKIEKQSWFARMWSKLKNIFKKK